MIPASCRCLMWLFVIVALSSIQLSRGELIVEPDDQGEIFCYDDCIYHSGTIGHSYNIRMVGVYHRLIIEYYIDDEERDYEISYELISGGDIRVDVDVFPSEGFFPPSGRSWAKRFTVYEGYSPARSFKLQLDQSSWTDRDSTFKIQINQLESSKLALPVFAIVIIVIFGLVVIGGISGFCYWMHVLRRRHRQRAINVPIPAFNNHNEVPHYEFQQIVQYQNLQNNEGPQFPDQNFAVLQFQQRQLQLEPAQNNFVFPILNNNAEGVPIELTVLQISIGSSLLTENNINEKFPEIVFEEIKSPFIQDTCSICYDDFKAGDMCRQLYCKHIFHSGCVKEWFINQLRKKQADCPNCHKNMMKESRKK